MRKIVMVAALLSGCAAIPEPSTLELIYKNQCAGGVTLACNEVAILQQDRMDFASRRLWFAPRIAEEMGEGGYIPYQDSKDLRWLDK